VITPELHVVFNIPYTVMQKEGESHL